MTPERNLRRNNHYVPRFLLSNFSLPEDATKVFEYRLLVGHKNIPDWEARPIKMTARHVDLYTVADESGESDALETWLDEQFENPGAPCVQRLLSGGTLNANCFRALVNLFAAQLVRTPAWYIRHKVAWAEQLEREIEIVKQQVEAERPNLKLEQNRTEIVNAPDGFPLRMLIRREGDKYHMRGQSVTGRKMWMWSIRHVLRPGGPLSKLHSFRWSILEAPANVNWILSDNPAVSYVVHSNNVRDYAVPLDTVGAHLMLPLGPKHLLYHRVGLPLQERYTVAHPMLAQHLREILIEAAHRSIYSPFRDLQITSYRPKLISAERASYEREEWAKFGAEQGRAERYETFGLLERSDNKY